MCPTWIMLLTTAVAMLATTIDAQQSAAELEQTIINVFDDPPPRRKGPNDIEISETNYIPTTAPTVLVEDGVPCTCVPYFMCDPKTNTTTPQTSAPNAPEENSEGYGLIDIRFGSDANVCEEYLDVCCKDLNRNGGTPIPKPPPKVTGCGIRNPRLDFGLIGNTVGAYLYMNLY